MPTGRSVHAVGACAGVKFLIPERPRKRGQRESGADTSADDLEPPGLLASSGCVWKTTGKRCTPSEKGGKLATVRMVRPWTLREYVRRWSAAGAGRCAGVAASATPSRGTTVVSSLTRHGVHTRRRFITVGEVFEVVRRFRRDDRGSQTPGELG